MNSSTTPTLQEARKRLGAWEAAMRAWDRDDAKSTMKTLQAGEDLMFSAIAYIVCLDDRASKAEARIRVLEEALRPFATLADHHDALPDTYRLSARRRDNYRVAATLGDCRQAARALTKEAKTDAE